MQPMGNRIGVHIVVLLLALGMMLGMWVLLFQSAHAIREGEVRLRVLEQEVRSLNTKYIRASALRTLLPEVLPLREQLQRKVVTQETFPAFITFLVGDAAMRPVGLRSVLVRETEGGIEVHVRGSGTFAAIHTALQRLAALPYIAVLREYRLQYIPAARIWRGDFVLFLPHLVFAP